jgi:hypothetical protein
MSIARRRVSESTERLRVGARSNMAFIANLILLLGAHGDAAWHFLCQAPA